MITFGGFFISTAQYFGLLLNHLHEVASFIAYLTLKICTTCRWTEKFTTWVPCNLSILLNSVYQKPNQKVFINSIYQKPKQQITF